MKTLPVVLALATLAALAFPAAAVPGLVSWFKADGTALDETGANSGVLTGAASYAAGFSGKAFKFNGNYDSVRLADSPSLAITGSLTISANVYVSSFPSPGGIEGCIVFRGDQRPGFDPYVLSVVPDSALLFHIAADVNGVDMGVDLKAGMPTGQWVSVTATLDGATGVMSLYENGYLVNRTVTSIRPFARLDPNENPGVGIGNHSAQPQSTQHQPFTGMIDDLKIYNTAVPPVQPWKVDVDQNGIINIADAAKALRIIAGLEAN